MATSLSKSFPVRAQQAAQSPNKLSPELANVKACVFDVFGTVSPVVHCDLMGQRGQADDRALRPIFAFDKSLHRALRLTDDQIVRVNHCTVFSHSLDPL